MATKGTIIVTGASQGIGAGAVQAFLEHGYNVVANSRHITSSGTFRESDKLSLVAGNIGEIVVAAKIVETAITRFGSIDALVNNAGIFFAKPFTEFTAEDFDTLSTVNLKGFPLCDAGVCEADAYAEQRWQRRQYHRFDGR